MNDPNYYLKRCNSKNSTVKNGHKNKRARERDKKSDNI